MEDRMFTLTTRSPVASSQVPELDTATPDQLVLNATTSQRDARSERSWYAAPHVLDAMLALCEPPGWDLTPDERMGRRHGALNAMRLWSMFDQLAGEPGTSTDKLQICAPKEAWNWERWRRRAWPDHEVHFDVFVKLSSGELRFAVCAQRAPNLLRRLEAKAVMHDTDDGGMVWLWQLRPAVVHMAYPQARAFIAALVFSADAADVYVGVGDKEPI
jgi:hypothetical protein